MLCAFSSNVSCTFPRRFFNQKKEKINKVSLIAFTVNDIGNAFWNTIEWTERKDLNYYEFVLNEENITAFNEQ